ncbi:Qat anti-phage system QueC-like protein QatC [Brevundimonas sp. A19_0]|uniref:Qat anti-phage system QueC-like protein QatC n=1 Tax=Brevundimonas sp. A19_0 TaxID=2821087 RepID=UPI001ADB9487|nr:Qat anti-phage system QueC-like protein QatC [Brevundimonas sp. A19_0]MBO9501205.1 hypothetical protein [Brevundimonas sp. A19_0]
MRVSCAPAGTAFPTSTDIPFILYGYKNTPNEGAIGAAIPPYFRGLKLQPSARAWDFLSFALSVVAADESCTRSTSPDGWTRQIDLTVAVVDPAFWNGVAPELEQMLQFVTGDIWKVAFFGGGYLPAPPIPVQHRTEDIVCLLSGGMDSLIGAIDLVAQGHKPLLVSQVAKGDKKDQSRFARTISPQSLHIQLNHNASPPIQSERSQRARSMVFFGLGVLSATCLEAYAKGATIDLIVPENGFISLNIPLTPMRVGSLSTRTTHPFYLGKLQSVLTAAGLNVQLQNPYQLKTKGEMLAGCANQTLLKSLIGGTTSCGRYARTGFTQCGRCVPCLVRRASFLRWGVTDSTPSYKYDNLGLPGRKHMDFDDVRSAAYAVHLADSRGRNAWIGGSLNSAQLGPTTDLEDTALRGLAELETLLKAHGVI